ncbi:hypothetical protein JAO76_14910 [Pontibacter sp. BT310]|uniref:Uncharacterized protein n=1 Tax=Pontibacter populi TaxID=890055 RepID=A0ABS6XGV5_9BACT|nr:MULTISPECIES: hypothetical protein [Pontibacter]MBJ6119497.1 hypothetical protein [Pontibacter sp. BT310]MBR0571925.1 hypothetical protein [Microvirga sp. STS03]MBW3366351.1 hypothetical protein [Pontibacter populi]
MTIVSFSIPKLLFNGCNIELAGINETLEAVGLMAEILGIDFSKFHNSRLDITTNIKSSIRASAYVKHLKNPPYFKGCNLKKKGIYYHTAAELKDSARVLSLYDKEDLLRIEARLFSKAELGQSANYLFKRHLKHEALVSELTKESFYVNSVYYLNDLVQSAIPKCKIKAESIGVYEELRSSLDSNLRYTLPDNLLRNVC